MLETVAGVIPDKRVRRLSCLWRQSGIGRPHNIAEGGMQDVQSLVVNYLPIVIFLVIAAALSVAFILASALIAPKKPDSEKLSAYECGFNAFDDARMKFDVRFYLVSILFIIFDLEVAFLFPWIFEVSAGNVAAFWSMMAFLGVLTVGFVYEWRRGALEWQ
jgi:NADH-quinone oxidoreductase subunit A